MTNIDALCPAKAHSLHQRLVHVTEYRILRLNIGDVLRQGLTAMLKSAGNCVVEEFGNRGRNM
jgi:hypothetical protein